jgi:hypothetical protein
MLSVSAVRQNLTLLSLKDENLFFFIYLCDSLFAYIRGYATGSCCHFTETNI